MDEIWKKIDDRYSVSNLGRVKSNYANKEKILKPTPDVRGYLKVDLRHGETRKSMMVHRLVALAFIDNPDPDNFKEVNHKDENKANNCVDNLEWCDTKYNCNYGTRNQRKSENCKKRVCSVDIYGNVAHYNSRNEAAKLIGIDATNISKSLRANFSQNITAGGMLWFYDDGNVEQMVIENGIKAKPFEKAVYSIDTNGKIEKYSSYSQAHKETGINNIIRSIKNGTLAGGRHWFYDN